MLISSFATIGQPADQQGPMHPRLSKAPMKRISDEELLERQFRYDDPEGLTGLCRERPDGSLEPEIVGYYRLRPSGGRAANPAATYIWCCHCQKPTHWDGRVLKDNSAKTYIIGADCGRKHYGDKFVAIDRAFDEQLARQKLLARWSQIELLRDQMLAEVDTVLKDPVWRTIDLKRQELHAAKPDFVFRLSPLIKRGGSLIIREQLRDVAEEERRQRSYERAKARYKSLSKSEQAQMRRDGLAPERDDSPIYRTHEENLGPVRGRHVVIDDGDVRSCAIRLRDLLVQIAPIDKLGNIRNTQLSRTLADIREASERLRGAFEENAGAWRFFEPANLDAVDRWYGSIRHTPFARKLPTGREVHRPIAKAITPLISETHYYPPALDLLLESDPTDR